MEGSKKVLFLVCVSVWYTNRGTLLKSKRFIMP